jgi:SAM-dependent methyltransferase
VTGRSSARREVESLVDQALGDRAPLRVLDAGCGGATRFTFSAPARIVGIDSSARQLERHPGLDEKIVGDVQLHRFTPSSFDVVIAWQLYVRSVEWDVQRRLREQAHLVGRLWSVFKFAVRVVSAGRVDAERTDLVIVLRKLPSPRSPDAARRG